ncbi:MAG TPA: hypothetical protein VNE83_07615 [Terriglobales bacterium]|nr:hypothetical protein [Terriglobales bacterium]
MKTSLPPPRAPRYNRFQTAVSGVAFVHTAIDSHFDPYTETARPLHISSAEMETVPRIEVGPSPTAPRR